MSRMASGRSEVVWLDHIRQKVNKRAVLKPRLDHERKVKVSRQLAREERTVQILILRMNIPKRDYGEVQERYSLLFLSKAITFGF